MGNAVQHGVENATDPKYVKAHLTRTVEEVIAESKALR